MTYSAPSQGYNAGGCSNSCGYSSLESMVSSYSSSNAHDNISYLIAAEPLQQTAVYDFETSGFDLYSGKSLPQRIITRTYYSSLDNWLMPDHISPFVGDANEVKEFVEEAFRAVTGKEFPNDVMIRLLDKSKLNKAYSMFKLGKGVQGFAINRKGFGFSEIFIKKDELSKVMLTIGHELGHVLTRRLDNDTDEEAKAFSFSLAWMKIIKENNIANLSTAIRLDKPAVNGLHDVALDSVLDEIKQGRDAYDVYLELIGK